MNLSETKKRQNNSENFDKTVKKHKFNRRKASIIAIASAIAIIVAGTYFCFAKLLFVKAVDVVVTQESLIENPYTEEELFIGLGIEKGMGLYAFDAGEAERKAEYNLPYFKEIKVSRRWPGTVVAKVVLEKPEFYCEISDNLYIVSSDLKVLEYTTDARKIKINSLIYLETSGIHNCIVGEELGLENDSKEIISELLPKLEEYGMSDNITSLDVSDRFNIEFMYDTVYLVKLGDIKNLDAKMHYLSKIVEDREGNIGGGIIDLSNVSKKEAKFDKFS